MEGTGLKGDNKQGLSAYLKEQEALRPDVPLYVTGHSLGGAVSTLGVHAALMEGREGLRALHVRLAARRQRHVRERARGQRRQAGTKLFCAVNYGDPVSVSPPAWLSYGHVAVKGEKEDEGNKRFFRLPRQEHGRAVLEDAPGAARLQRAALARTGRATRPRRRCTTPRASTSASSTRLSTPTKCIEVASAKANPACLDLANAVASAVSRPTTEGGCGDSYDDSVKAYLEAAACSKVKGLVDEKRFRT